MGHGAEMSGPNQGGVFVKRAGAARRVVARSPRRPAAGQLVDGDVDRNRPRRAVDPDYIVVFDERDRSAGGGFGARVANADPPVAPENLPSVTNATFSPMPWPYISAVTPSISRMPGPPLGPSPRITMTAPSG